jgi:hypothetical protein
MTQETKDKIKAIKQATKDKKAETVSMPVMDKKYNLRITGKEINTWDFITPMRKSLRKHGQYILLHKLETIILRSKDVAEAKEILSQYFIFVIKEK